MNRRFPLISNPAFRAIWRPICLKCLAKEAHRRYPSALELANDIDRYLADCPIQARRTPLGERGLKWARRRPGVAILLTITCVVVILAGLAAFRSAADLRAEIDRDEAALIWISQ